jgi:nucleotide-binding universal stress UspA family protein
VQRPLPNTDSDPVTRGKDIIKNVATRAGLDPDEYEGKVVVDADIEEAIIEAVNRYNTICVGLSERSEASRLMFGTIAERISQEATGNVGIVRGVYDGTESEKKAPRSEPSH